MGKITHSLLFILLCTLFISSCTESNNQGANEHGQRYVSITIDDLPTVSATDLKDRQQITKNLIDKITRYNIPAVGFVNEIKLGGTVPDPQEVDLLKRWLDAGLELANHTYSHMDFSENSLEDFQNDILKGEIITRPLMEEYGKKLQWFRHPYLSVGRDPQKRLNLEGFLDEHGYRSAPVTIDNADWVYNNAYNTAWRQNDKDAMQKIADDYIRYMDEVIEYIEVFSFDVLEEPLPQILLIHANRLNADHFHRVADLFLSRGYEFITLNEAMKTHDYISSDGLFEPIGPAWLQQIWVSSGNQPRYRPNIPEWIHELTNRR